MEPSITLASPSDIPTILELVNCVYRKQEGLQGWTSEYGIIEGNRTSADELQNEMKDQHVTFFKCVDNEQTLIGCVYGHHYPEEAKMTVGMLSIHPVHQSKGIGGKMMTAVEALAVQKNCSRMVVYVVHVRDKLLAWYARIGYKKTGRTFPFPTQDGTFKFGKPLFPIHFVEMEKHLN